MRGLTERQHHGAPRGLMSLFLPKSVMEKDSFLRRCVFGAAGGSPRLLAIRGDCEAPDVLAQC